MAHVIDTSATLISVRSDPGCHEVARTTSTIGKSDPEAYRVEVNVSGTSGVRHCGRPVVLGPGQMGLYDSSQPFEGWRDPSAVQTSTDRTMFLRIRQFIDTNLNDVGLTPKAIAAAHFISLRTLQRLFAGQDLTVAGWIRTRRLQKCRDDLRNPLLANHSVQAVGARWGFVDQAHFSRAFSRAYGMSPRACRAERASVGALSQPVGAQ